jgi:hypothetical protein
MQKSNEHVWVIKYDCQEQCRTFYRWQVKQTKGMGTREDFCKFNVESQNRINQVEKCYGNTKDVKKSYRWEEENVNCSPNQIFGKFNALKIKSYPPKI